MTIKFGQQNPWPECNIVYSWRQKSRKSQPEDNLPREGALNFFSGRGVRPGFPKCGACELTFASEKGGLWAENFQIWGLVSWKFPNLGACELKFGWKFRMLRLKFPNFLKRGSCELTLWLEMGPLRAAGEAWKGGLQGRTSPYPLSRSVPPPGNLPRTILWLSNLVKITLDQSVIHSCGQKSRKAKVNQKSAHFCRSTCVDKLVHVWGAL